jgi:hypothetical protein
MAFVQQVLDVRAKFHNFVQSSFKQDRNFARALKEALEHFINLDSRAAQYLSLYIDDMFKTKIKVTHSSYHFSHIHPIHSEQVNQYNKKPVLAYETIHVNRVAAYWVCYLTVCDQNEISFVPSNPNVAVW